MLHLSKTGAGRGRGRARRASAARVVVLDVKTGGVLAAYSNPTFDPNLLVTHNPKMAQAAFEFLPLLPTNPLLARAWREIYPPGSTFKTVTAAITLQNNVDVDKKFPRRRSISAAAHHGGTEELRRRALRRLDARQLHRVVQHDLRPDRSRSRQHARDRASSSSACRPHPPPSDGSDLDPPIVREHRARCPARSSTHAAAVRAGGDRPEPVAVTPLQMALVAESVATGGVILEPHVVDCVEGPERQSRLATSAASSSGARWTPRPRRR